MPTKSINQVEPRPCEAFSRRPQLNVVKPAFSQSERSKSTNSFTESSAGSNCNCSSFSRVSAPTARPSQNWLSVSFWDEAGCRQAHDGAGMGEVGYGRERSLTEEVGRRPQSVVPGRVVSRERFVSPSGLCASRRSESLEFTGRVSNHTPAGRNLSNHLMRRWHCALYMSRCRFLRNQKVQIGAKFGLGLAD
jgi:hypothetical protein